MNLLKNNPAPAWSLYADTVERYAYYDNVFSKEECERIVSYGKTYSLNQASVFGDNVNGDGEKIRDSYVNFLTPDPEFSWVYQRLTDSTLSINQRYFNFDLWGFTESLQFTEYREPGGKYDEHIDKIYGGVIRKLSIVVQLTDPDEYDGGDFQYIDGPHPINMTRSQGSVLYFPSYSLHRVTPVTRGVRNSLVGWISGVPFK